MKNLFALALLTAALAGCGGGGGEPIATPGPDGSSPTERIAALEAQGKLPKLDRSADLKGPDANGNGVRDDIESVLGARYQGEQLQATMQYARSYQSVFDIPEGDRVAAKGVKINSTRAMACMVSRFNAATKETHPDLLTDQIVAMTFNTKARMKVYMQYNLVLSGSVWSWPEGDTCE